MAAAPASAPTDAASPAAPSDIGTRGGAASVDWGRGVAMACAAVFFFAVYNAIAKELSGTYNPLQIVFFRGLFGLIPLAAFVWRARVVHGRPPRLRSRRPDLQLARALSAFAGTAALILSYRFLPLADAVSITYAAPIFVTLLSVPLLAERVGPYRWAAVGAGFVGVLMIARPGQGLVDPAALLAIVGTVFYALCLVITRKLAAYDESECTMLHSTGFYVGACALTLPFVWVAPGWGDLALFLALGLVAGCGMFLLVGAYRHADAAAIAPFDYLTMGWAAILGYAIWGEVPSAWTLAGIAVIAVSGLTIARREQIVARRRAGADAPA